MIFSRQFIAFVCSGFLLASAASSSLASWLVYELKFQSVDDDSLNFSFYTGAYVVAPIAGGPASIILTTEQDGRFYAVSQESARFFTAANPKSKKAALSAFAITGSAQAFYSASGLINETIRIQNGQELRSYQVAAALKGMLVAADDDSEASELPDDGSIGMIGSSIITGQLRSDLTHNANQYARQADIVFYLIGLLERYGYTPDGDVPASTIEGTLAPEELDPQAASAALFPAGSNVDSVSSTEPSSANSK